MPNQSGGSNQIKTNSLQERTSESAVGVTVCTSSCLKKTKYNLSLRTSLASLPWLIPFSMQQILALPLLTWPQLCKKKTLNVSSISFKPNLTILQWGISQSQTYAYGGWDGGGDSSAPWRDSLDINDANILYSAVIYKKQVWRDSLDTSDACFAGYLPPYAFLSKELVMCKLAI